jgi:hypothetical protein
VLLPARWPGTGPAPVSCCPAQTYRVRVVRHPTVNGHMMKGGESNAMSAGLLSRTSFLGKRVAERRTISNVPERPEVPGCYTRCQGLGVGHGRRKGGAEVTRTASAGERIPGQNNEQGCVIVKRQ